MSNIKVLENLLNAKIQKAMVLTKDEVFNIIFNKVMDYYNESVFNNDSSNIPKYYARGTDKMSLMESLISSPVIKKGTSYTFTVGFPDEYLEFRYQGGFTTKKYGSQYNAITGEQVLQAFNSGTHGYTVKGTHNYWNEALSEINDRGGIGGIFIQNLIKLGVPIK